MRFFGPGGPYYQEPSLWWLHALFSFLIVVALVVGVVFIVRLLLTRPTWWRGHPPRHPALDELDLRYARGEVSREEYLQRRADLLGAGGPQPPFPPSGPGPGTAA